MPKKETGRKVPMGKAERKKMKRTATGFNGTEGSGYNGLWHLIFGAKKNKKGK